MDNQATQEPVSDDQELAKVLAGVTEQADETEAAGAGTMPGAPVPQPVIMPTPPVAAPAVDPAELEAAGAQELSVPSFAPTIPTVPSMPAPVVAPSPAPVSGSLDSVKQDAISELRPLVDKLSVSPEEKFDTYLLLIRSTDDKSLIAPAHEAAKAIQDDAKRADALLNIIKEIDYLSAPQQ